MGYGAGVRFIGLSEGQEEAVLICQAAFLLLTFSTLITLVISIILIVYSAQVIEDQSKFRLEELSYPETRLLTLYIGGDKDQKFDQDLVVGETH